MNKNYVKEYKGYKVPEGATHYNEGNMLWPECFINKNTGEVYKLDEPRIWVLSERVMPTTAIELPEEQSQEWVDGLPPVGCECEVKHGGSWVSSEVLRKHPITKCVAVMFLDSNHLKWTDGQHIRPLKTQEQKDREAFIESAMSLNDGAEMGKAELVLKMFDAGFKAPEGE
jgi:hypothetical protein